MIYSIVGTQTKKREEAQKEIAKEGSPSQHIYSEHVKTLESFIDSASLFGGKEIVLCVQLGESASSKEELVRLLPRMKDSETIFIIDEPFADVHLTNKLAKVSEKLFNTKEEKIKDVRVFKLCDSFAARDKRQAWLDFMDIRNDEGGEAIQGALWWKFQIVWSATNEGRRTPYTKKECERIGKDLMKSSILAHRGELDLMTEIERIILSI